MEYANHATGPLFEMANIVAEAWYSGAQIEPFYATGATASDGYQITPDLKRLYVCALSGKVSGDFVMREDFSELVSIEVDGTIYLVFYGVNIFPGKGSILIGYRLTSR